MASFCVCIYLCKLAAALESWVGTSEAGIILIFTNLLWSAHTETTLKWEPFNHLCLKYWVNFTGNCVSCTKKIIQEINFVHYSQKLCNYNGKYITLLLITMDNMLLDTISSTNLLRNKKSSKKGSYASPVTSCYDTKLILIVSILHLINSLLNGTIYIFHINSEYL